MQKEFRQMVRYAAGGQADGEICRRRSGRRLGMQKEVRQMVGYDDE